MSDVPQITVILPRVLAEMTGGQRQFVAEGETLGDALLYLGREVPGLQVHLFNETGQVRRHIICIQGETFIRAGQIAAQSASDGEEIRIINALAGG